MDELIKHLQWYWEGKTEVRGEKTCLSARWTDLAMNPGLRGEGSATIKLGLLIFMVFIVT